MATAKVVKKKAKYEEPDSTRLTQLKEALKSIDFGYTVFFTSERGQSIRLYQGATVQNEAV
jgi:hypothetical protein